MTILIWGGCKVSSKPKWGNLFKKKVIILTFNMNSVNVQQKKNIRKLRLLNLSVNIKTNYQSIMKSTHGKSLLYQCIVNNNSCNYWSAKNIIKKIGSLKIRNICDYHVKPILIKTYRNIPLQNPIKLPLSVKLVLQSTFYTILF